MLKDLNKYQKMCVTHETGPLLVLAGPGSGKTHTLTKRIQYLTDVCNVPQSKILVITFTKEAALSMQRRFERLKPNSSVVFGTFHSVFFSILKKESNKDYSLISQKQKNSIVMSVMHFAAKEKGVTYKKQYMAEEASWVLFAIASYKCDEDLRRAVRELAEPWTSLFEIIFAKYNEELERERLIDFEDMIYQCRKLLMDNEYIRNKYQNMFSHILIDEFQDIDSLQYDTLKLLSKPPYNIFAVGDDDQSIYGFRGSNSDCMKKFVEDFCAQTLALSVNYRSGKEIIKASKIVIEENEGRFEKTFYPYDHSKKSLVRIMNRENEKEEAALIVEKIKQEKDKETVVLFRTNTSMQLYERLFNNLGIYPDVKGVSLKIASTEVGMDLIAYLNCAKCVNQGDLLRIINKPGRGVSKSFIYPDEKISLDSIIKMHQEMSDMPYINETIINLKKFKKDLDMIGKMPAYGAVKYIFNVCGLSSYYKKIYSRDIKKREEAEELSALLIKTAEECESFEEFIDILSNRKKNNGRDSAKVVFMTCHAAKGLEFKRVFIPDCNERNYPHGMNTNILHEQEERRLFYVGMTRASEELYMIYQKNEKNPGKKMSRFLNKLTEYEY